MRSAVRPLALLLAAMGAACAPSGALSFGSINGWIFSNGPFNAEHEMITRAALSCEVPDKVPNCFEPRSLDNLAGRKGTFGAVAAPDNYSTLGGGPAYWHCDEADAFEGVLPNYPVALQAARSKLTDCRTYAYLEFNMGTRGTSYNRRGTNDGAVGGARFLLNTKGQVDVSDLSGSSCTFNLSSGRAKCNVLESFGRGLHVVQDFYSHSNWGDRPAPGPVSLTNPPGLGREGMATTFWNMNVPTESVWGGLATGCYPTSDCKGRVTHDEGLNKDRVVIDWRQGLAATITCTKGEYKVCTDRGDINGDLSNQQRAVRAAIEDTRRQWADLQARIIRKEGGARGTRMICAIHRDDITTVCNATGAAGSRQAAGAAVTPVGRERARRVPAAPRPAAGLTRACGAMRPGDDRHRVRVRVTGTSCTRARAVVRALAGEGGRGEAVAVPGEPHTRAFVTGPLRGARVAEGRSITVTSPGQRVVISPA